MEVMGLPHVLHEIAAERDVDRTRPTADRQQRHRGEDHPRNAEALAETRAGTAMSDAAHPSFDTSVVSATHGRLTRSFGTLRHRVLCQAGCAVAPAPLTRTLLSPW